MVDVVFNRAVNYILPHGIPTHLDRSAEYALGDILVFEKKLRTLMPWRKHRLAYTGVNFSKLLTELVDVTSGVEPIFDSATTSRSFGDDAKIDTDIQSAVAHFGINLTGTEHANMTVDFGKIERHFSNLPDVLNNQAEQQLYISMTHPVIRDAKAHNKTLFVISSLYVAEKAVVNLSFDRSLSTSSKGSMGYKAQPTASQSTDLSNDTIGMSNTSDPLSKAVDAASAMMTLDSGSGADVKVSFSITGNSVIERSTPTNIAYRVMRIKLGRHGALLPQPRAAIHNVKVRVIDETNLGSKTTSKSKNDYNDDTAAMEDEL